MYSPVYKFVIPILNDVYQLKVEISINMLRQYHILKGLLWIIS